VALIWGRAGGNANHKIVIALLPARPHTCPAAYAGVPGMFWSGIFLFERSPEEGRRRRVVWFFFFFFFFFLFFFFLYILDL